MSLPHSFLSGKGGGAKDWIYSGISGINQSASNSNGSPLQTTYTNSDNATGAIKLSPDGTKMITFQYSGGHSGVSSYDLSTPFDLSTAWRGNNYHLSALGGASDLVSANMSWDGKYAYTIHGRDSIATWELPTPWDFGGANYVGTGNTLEGQCQACGISKDGTEFWTYHRSNDRLLHYSLATPYNFSSSSHIAAKSINGWMPWGNSSQGNIYGMYVSQDGKNLTFYDMNENTSGFYTWKLSTGFDFTTMHSPVYNHMTWVSNAMGLDIHKDWLYVSDPYDQGQIRQVSINTN